MEVRTVTAERQTPPAPRLRLMPADGGPTGGEAPAARGWRPMLPPNMAVIGPDGIAVYYVLAEHADRQTGVCWPSQQRIADALGINRKRVIAALKRLQNGGYVTVEGPAPRSLDRTHRYTLPHQKPGSFPLSRGGTAIVPPRDNACPVEGQPLSRGGTQTEIHVNRERETDGGASHRAAPAASAPAAAETAAPPNAEPRRPVTRPTPPPPSSRASGNTTDGRVYALVDAFAAVTARTRAQLQGRERKETADAFRPLDGAVTAEDVRDCTAYLRTDPFWREPGKLTARKLAATLPEWIAAGRPEAQVPRPPAGSRTARGRPFVEGNLSNAELEEHGWEGRRP